MRFRFGDEFINKIRLEEMIYDFLPEDSIPYSFSEVFLFFKYKGRVKEPAADLVMKCFTSNM